MPIQMILMVFLLGILLPALLPFLIALVGYLIPDVGAFLSKVLWAVLGDLETVKIAAGVLEGAFSYQYTPKEYLLANIVNLLSGALLEAAVFGCCIYLVKSLFVQFRNGIVPGAYRIGGVSLYDWQLNVLGIVLGAVVVTSGSTVFREIQAVLEASVGIFCVIAGTLIMTRKHRADNTNINRNPVIENLLTQILVNMGTAMLSAALLVCMMEGPSLAREQEVLGVLMCLILYLVIGVTVLYWLGSIILYFVSLLLLGILRALLKLF